MVPARLTAADTRDSFIAAQSFWFSVISLRTVTRFCGKRLVIVFFARFSEVEIFIVRSNGRRPSPTCCRISTA